MNYNEINELRLKDQYLEFKLRAVEIVEWMADVYQINSNRMKEIYYHQVLAMIIKRDSREIEEEAIEIYDDLADFYHERT
jgi:hypothetical protein